jgi:hypothetical protein
MIDEMVNHAIFERMVSLVDAQPVFKMSSTRKLFIILLVDLFALPRSTYFGFQPPKVKTRLTRTICIT